MSGTRKGTAKHARRDIEIGKTDGGFDVLLNGQPSFSRISVDELYKILCERFGFCGDEFTKIMEEINENGSKTILL